MSGQSLAVKATAALLAVAACGVLLVVAVLDPSTAAASCATSSTPSLTPASSPAGGGLLPTGNPHSAGMTSSPGTGSDGEGSAPAGLDAEAQANARVVAAVVADRKLPAVALVVVYAAALAESGLHNDDYGDTAGPDSRGILQQRDSWGPLAVRMDPAGAAGLFLDRLENVAGWQQLSPWVAAQDVQVSAFDGHPRAANNYSSVFGGNYQAKTQLAIQLTQQLYGDPAIVLTCTGSGGASGPAGPVPIAIPALPGAPAAYTGPADGGPCNVPDNGGCIRQATDHLRTEVLTAFPTTVRSTGCYSNRAGDHGTGAACDFMTTTGQAATGQDLIHGWQLAAWVRANAAALHVAYVIWYVRIWDARHPAPDDNGGWGQPYTGCSYCPPLQGDPSASHTNHVHVSIISPETE